MGGRRCYVAGTLRQVDARVGTMLAQLLEQRVHPFCVLNGQPTGNSVHRLYSQPTDPDLWC